MERATPSYLDDSFKHSDGSAVVALVVRSVGLLLHLLQLVCSHQLVPSFFVVWGALQLKENKTNRFVFYPHYSLYFKQDNNLNLPLLQSPPWLPACCPASTGCFLSATWPESAARPKRKKYDEHRKKIK